jgi:predicted MFS family arabinose efflux permease
MGLLSSFSLLGSGFGSILVGELLIHFEYQSVFRIGAIIALFAIVTGWKKH